MNCLFTRRLAPLFVALIASSFAWADSVPDAAGAVQLDHALPEERTSPAGVGRSVIQELGHELFDLLG